jgi:hypothetical protein
MITAELWGFDSCVFTLFVYLAVIPRAMRTAGPKRADGWRRLHNEKLHNLYTSPNTIRVTKLRIEMGGACSTHESWYLRYCGWKT